MPGRFLLIDPSIESLAGHHLEYASVVLHAAREAGYAPLLATNRRFQSPPDNLAATYAVYKYGFWAEPLRLGRSSLLKTGLAYARRVAKTVLPVSARWNRQRSDRIRMAQFAQDTADWLRQVKLQAGDEIFLPTVGHVELDGLLRALPHIENWQHARWHLVFRRDLMPSEHRQFARVFERAKRLSPSDRVYFYTDTDELSAAYQDLVGLSFATLPIPHAGPAITRPTDSTGPLRILYLGDARTEKGYHHLPGIIESVWPDCVATGKVAFVIQSNSAAAYEEPEVTAARQRLRAMAPEAVTLLVEPLPSDAYRRILASGDIMLLPYDPAAYQRRSSGILAEALAAAVLPIVPADTWLARQLPKEAEALESAVGLTYRYIDQVPDLVRRLVSHIESHRAAARAFAVSWATQHSAANLVKMLTSRK